MLSRLASGDALIRSVLDEAFTQPTITATERAETEALLRHRFGVDVPLFYLSFSTPPGATAPAWQWHGMTNQYHRWLESLLHGNLGYSYREGAAVADLLKSALQYTLPLTFLAAILAVALTFEFCIWLGSHPAWRSPILSTLYVVQSIPLFVIALVLLLLFANPDVFTWFPAYGLGSIDSFSPWTGALGQYLYHLVLPLLSLILVSVPSLAIQLNASIQMEAHALYVATARAKGVAPRAVVRRHIVRNALLPVLPLLTELVPNVVAGSVVVEMIFALPGMGRLLAEAASAQDYPVLLGAVLLVSLARLFSQLLADLLYQWIDPRIRLSA
ncbi:ABC transporter permease [Hymenobacter wooponensis]|uniref:ABC transporter permease n=1 Tax=Hymenobacter wooponensis TaxID=1525360 RepID=UPI001436BF63|nr:ABC transporter permease [Hymenobacter wooponensis]